MSGVNFKYLDESGKVIIAGVVFTPLPQKDDFIIIKDTAYEITQKIFSADHMSVGILVKKAKIL